MGDIIWDNTGLTGIQHTRKDGSKYTAYEYDIQIAFGGLELEVSFPLLAIQMSTEYAQSISKAKVSCRAEVSFIRLTLQ